MLRNKSSKATLTTRAEIVDSQDKIDDFLPALEELMSGGIVAIEKFRVLRYGS